jgi:hypothetical protein
MAPKTTFLIMHRLTKWHSCEPPSIAQTNLPGLLAAVQAQDHVRWLVFFEGCIAAEWAGFKKLISSG